MTKAIQNAKRRQVDKSFLIVAALVMIGGCRQKRAEEVKVVPAVPSGDVSDGILEGLQQELEAARKQDAVTAERIKPVKPVLECVEALSATQWRAHFGYTNSSREEIPISVSIFNRFWPPPVSRKQPTVFLSGSREDAAEVTFNPRSSTAWVLGSAFAMANGSSAQYGAKALTIK